jgi:hypothetical protein
VGCLTLTWNTLTAYMHVFNTHGVCKFGLKVEDTALHCNPAHAFLQILFVSGVALTIGPRATLKFFLRRKNYKVRRPHPPCGPCSLALCLAPHLPCGPCFLALCLAPSCCPPSSHAYVYTYTHALSHSLISSPHLPLPPRMQGSAFFLAGVGLVLWGWTFVGFGLEMYGFWLLFSAFFPTVLSFLRRMPFLKQVLDMPAFKTVRVGEAMRMCGGWVLGQACAVHAGPKL